MSPRRSARIQDLETQKPPEPEVVQPPAAKADQRRKKRKAPATHAEGSASTGRPNKKATKATKATLSKFDEAAFDVSYGPSEDVLYSLPAELFNMILDNIRDSSTIGRLARTCKRYYSIMIPLLHRRIAVHAYNHAHIAKFIRGLEPYLSIAQKKQLKKEGAYKGQQARYSSKLDPKAEPVAASYVQQLSIGVADPGRKHQYICHRYVEEALKTMNNLEIVETHFLTVPMGKSIASLQNLQALRVLHRIPADYMPPLSSLKNLKHLAVEGESSYYSSSDNSAIESMIVNSASTLRSLVIKSGPYRDNFLTDLEKRLAAHPTLAKRKHSLSALKRFTLHGVPFDAAFIKSLSRAIDFMGLDELILERLDHRKHIFYQHLAILALSSQSRPWGISLRNMSLDMSDDRWNETEDQIQANLEAKCSFISSFKTLTALELVGYGQNPRHIATNPDISNMLVHAIIKHTNLKSLKICYPSIISEHQIRYLTAMNVATIIDSLPELQEFEFAPEEVDIKEIGKALTRGRNLTAIKCYPCESYSSYPRPENPGFNLLEGIINGFLSHDNGKTAEKFKWEDSHKLKYICAFYQTWEIASEFGKAKKGIKEAIMITNAVTGNKVMIREVSEINPFRIRVGYKNDNTWIDQVVEDLA
ncbi:hypothetical protein BT63DRAFT_435437 [Microthyrium microscopicum]|uniref:F-box domain-containing protein n=1 Tax=Microthyrium microscopicum TaxID=703497 RepID=A0A6A6UTP1_9PEZI|nr:hypothetical protein BT63DRAFT_435437 [Microthyrium microscopicum]